MPRPLFGFRQVRGKIVPAVDELAVVRAVIAARKGQRIRAAQLHPGESRSATLGRLRRIREHLHQYRTGRVLLGLPPDQRLAALVKAKKLHTHVRKSA